jgi:hypothetical protein
VRLIIVTLPILALVVSVVAVAVTDGRGPGRSPLSSVIVVNQVRPRSSTYVVLVEETRPAPFPSES